jgi:diguanylate cyclase
MSKPIINSKVWVDTPKRQKEERQTKERQEEDRQTEGTNPLKNPLSDDPIAPSGDAKFLSPEGPLFDEMRNFLSENELSLSEGSLVLSFIAVSGSRPDIARKIRTHTSAGKALSEDWLQTITEECLTTEMPDPNIEALGKKLEDVVTGFAKTISSTHAQTGEFREQMALHYEHANIAAAAFGQSNGDQTAPPNAGEADLRHAQIAQQQADVVTLAKATLSTLGRIEAMIEQSQLETEVLRTELAAARQQAVTDQLTSLPNRRAFDAEFDAMLRRTLDNHQPMFLALCDVDHFKRVNDEFGHQTGDNLLCAIASILEKETTSAGFVSRHGGEEFAMLFEGLGEDEALAEINAARETLAERKFVARRKRVPIGAISFSAGLADVHAAGSKSDALRRADEALYAAKTGGRNQVVVAGPAA